jgi:hypothetical protein
MTVGLLPLATGFAYCRVVDMYVYIAGQCSIVLQ